MPTKKTLPLLAILFMFACGGTEPGPQPDSNSPAAGTPAGAGKADNGLGAPPQKSAEDLALESVFNVYEVNYLEGLPTGEAQRDNLCANDFKDRFARWYCGEDHPTATGIDELLLAMGLRDLGAPTPRNFAANGHSSSLLMRRTSSINPRMIYFSDVEAEPTSDYVTMGYVRGDFLVEIAAFDPSRNDLSFYLVKAEKACEPNCTNTDRFLPDADRDWQSLSVYAAEELQNTPVDCLSCHQPGGADTPRILRMQELVEPWTHWLQDRGGSRILLEQFLGAHDPSERYGGVPASRMGDSDPIALERFIRSVGFEDQPNMYDGELINFDSPSIEEPTPFWNILYSEAMQGRAISPPYFGIDPFDAQKLGERSAEYQAAVHGESTTLGDMNDVFRADALDELGFVAAEGLDAIGIVEHRCGFCHDGRFPGMTRDNFRVQDFPDKLSEGMKQQVINRLNLGKSSTLRMPPTLFTDLTPEQIEQVTIALD